MIWDQSDKPSDWSQTAEFGFGPTEIDHWTASWIGTGRTVRHTVPLFRREFELEKKPFRATLYVSCLGVYKAYINGAPIGDNVLSPEWTSYHRRVQFQAFDLTSLMSVGENVIAAEVAEGWYAGRIGLSGIDPSNAGYAIYGNRTALIAELRIEEDDGTVTRVCSDGSWRFTLDGPILSSDILDGEMQDGRRRIHGWAGADAAGGEWHSAVEYPELDVNLVPQENEPIRVLTEIMPKEVTAPANGIYVVNIGQNISGWIKLRLREETGRIISIRYGERLKDSGRVYTENLRSAAQTDRYISNGDGEEVFEPRFTYHGFQYAEITGLSHKPGPGDVTGCACWSSAPETGEFKCSNDLLNSLMSNIRWTQRDNMIGIPTDCPQRDERLGWCGDIQIYAQTACYNMNMAAFLRKWLTDLADDQVSDGRFPDFAPHPFGPTERFSGAPGWGDAGIVIPWTLYVNYGDVDIIRRMYEPGKRWIAWILEKNPDYLWKNERGNDYGDWLNADTFKADIFPKNRAELIKEIFATAYFFRSVRLLSKMASVLEMPKDFEFYSDLAGRIRDAFNGAYVKSDGKIDGETQAGYALALDYGLLREKLESRAFEHLIRGLDEFDGHLSTGFHGTISAMNQMMRFGRKDKAYEIATSTSFPSWGYTIQNGGTTIWERWDGWTDEAGFQSPEMNSFCHYAIGAVGEWLYAHVLGIQPLEEHPGYERFLVKPRPGGGVTWARGSYESIRGLIKIEWHHSDDIFTLTVTVPPCAQADIRVCADAPADVTVDDEAGLEPVGEQEGFMCFSAQSGTYTFNAPLKKQLGGSGNAH